MRKPPMSCYMKKKHTKTLTLDVAMYFKQFLCIGGVLLNMSYFIQLAIVQIAIGCRLNKKTSNLRKQREMVW